MQEQIDKQGAQVENMLTRINQMMETMQQMFSTIMSLVQKMIPDESTIHDTTQNTRKDISSPKSTLTGKSGGYLSTASPLTRVL